MLAAINRFKKSKTERVLFLHIGTGKAGSTTIQSFLQLMEDRKFATRPIIALGGSNAINLVAASRSEDAKRFFIDKNHLMTEDFFSENADTIWRAIREEVTQSPATKFVASSEFLSSLVRGSDIKYLRDRLFTCFDRVEIIVYLREQRSFLKSLWGQSVKGVSRSCTSFNDFVHGLKEDPRVWDYALLLREWQDGFGAASLNVCVFDRKAFHGGDLISDFSKKIGVSPNFARKRLRVKKNSSPSYQELEILRLRNASQNGDTSSDLTVELSRRNTFDSGAYEALVIELTATSNAWVNEKFLTSQKIKLPTASGHY